MAEFPSMPLWTDAYLGDTRHLSTIQHGAYLLLLIVSWRNGGDLPDDDKLLARYAGLTGQQWSRISATIRAFFTSEDGRLVQKKQRATINAVRQRHKRQSDGGQATALKNKEKAAAKHYGKHGGKQALSKTKTKEEKELPNGSSKKTARTMPQNWTPRPFQNGGVCASIIGGWTEDRYNREVEAFRAHHGSRANAMVDWQQAWQTWVLNADKFDRRATNGAGSYKRIDHNRTTGAAADAFGEPTGWTDRKPFKSDDDA